MNEHLQGKLELLTAQNSCLLLVDYQAEMLHGVASGDKTLIRKVAFLAAKAASILEIPTILTTISPKFGGEFFPDIQALFPTQPAIARTVRSFDALDDALVLEAIKQTGRKKLVLSGLVTSTYFAYTALHGIKEGLEVYGLMDAAGDSTPEAHRYGIHRMLQVGVVPITLEALVSEWMHDWENPKGGDLVMEVYSKYGAMLGLR